MSVKNNTEPRKIKTIVIGIAAFFLMMIIGCGFYVSDYYHATEAAVNAVSSNETVEITELSDGSIVFAPENADTGIIFYPGGKVAFEAYAPLMQTCAGQGILCVLVEMPFNLAVLDMNAADGIAEQYPEIEKWYMAGHSLGGSMAASYAAKHMDDFSGLILLAAYSTENLGDSNLEVLSLYGSNDQVLNTEKYNEYKGNIPQVEEVVIEGGNHAYFGVYGEQDGDGVAEIDHETQIRLTAEAIARFVQ